MTRDNQLTGNIGLFYSCYYLSWLGWNAMPTSRNMKGIDIIATKDGKCIGIQVKSFSNKTDIPLGKNLDFLEDKLLNYWIILFGVKQDEEPSAYIIKNKEILNNIKQNKTDFIHYDEAKDGTRSYYLKRSIFTDSSKYLNNWKF